VLGIIGWSIATKVRTGSGLPAGPSGLLGAVEGVSYLSLLGGEDPAAACAQQLLSVLSPAMHASDGLASVRKPAVSSGGRCATMQVQRSVMAAIMP
jgi:hypothetical protein